MSLGVTGTGKTMIVTAAAREADALLMVVRPSDVLSKYQGESERYIRSVFTAARQERRAIVFFDGLHCYYEYDAYDNYDEHDDYDDDDDDNDDDDDEHYDVSHDVGNNDFLLMLHDNGIEI